MDRARATPLAIAVSLVVVLALVAGCDPCAGLMQCSVASRVSVIGRLLDDSTGRPTRGAAVDFVRVGGVTLDRDSSRTTTEADGTFRFDIPAQAPGTTYADIVVRVPGEPGYRMRAGAYATTTIRGEADVLSSWSTKLSLPDLAIIYRRDGARANLPNVDVEFRQTGGARVEGLGATAFQTTADGNGYAKLFGRAVRPLESGDVIGDLEIKLPPPLGTTHHAVHIPVRSDFHAVAQARLFGAGPSLNYHFATSFRGNGLLVEGVRIDFRQDSGIAISPSTWTAFTDVTGRVPVPSQTETYGKVYGVITITPPTPWKAYERSVVLDAFDDDLAKLYAVYGVGPGIPYYVIIAANGVRAKGISVEFKRTGGVAVAPSTFKTVTDDSGAAFVSTAPAGEGDIVGDFTVRPPAPYATFVVRNVHVQGIDGDPPARILIGTWDLAAPPASAVRIP